MPYLTVTRSDSVAPSGDRSAWRLQVTVATEDEDHLPSELFVYHRVVNYGGHPTFDVFECVASLAQISEIGLSPVTDGPNPIPYYRKATVILDLRSATEVEQVYAGILSDLRHLVNNYTASLVLEVSEVTTL